MMPLAATVSGSIARGAHIINVLAAAPDGLALAEIVTQSGFSKTTAFRVLASLQEVGYTFQDPESRRYLLGRKLAHVSRLANRTDIAAVASRGMKRLAAITGDTVFLSVPEGAAAICVARVTGEFPIRTLTLNEGDTRPMGAGAGSLAMYCAMPPKRRTTLCRVNRNWLAEYGQTKAMLETDFDDYERDGYALNLGRIVAGTSAVAMPIVTSSGHLMGALAVGAVDGRVTQERINTVLIPALTEEVNLLAERMSQLETG